MFEIIPSPGTEDKEWSLIEKKIDAVKPFIHTVHIDIVDGKFAPNTSFLDPKPFTKYTKDIFFEVHLMVEEPINYLQSWADAGFRRFIGHVEHMNSQTDFVAKAQELGEVALALDKQTSIEAITVPFEDLDALLVMTIQAGASGQTFLEECLPKIQELQEKTLLPIEVDGGINDQTIFKAANVGATRFVATSFLFNNADMQQQITLLKEQLKSFV